MIYVRYIRNDGTDVAVFSNGVSTEDCDVCATSEVAGAANTVHHFATHNMSRVYVAKNIKFNCSIHGNNTKASCDTRVVGNFLRAKNNFFTVFIDIVIETFQPFWGRTQCSTGTYSYFICIDKVKHTILNNFSEDRQVSEWTFSKTTDYSVCYGTYTRLQWK